MGAVKRKAEELAWTLYGKELDELEPYELAVIEDELKKE